MPSETEPLRSRSREPRRAKKRSQILEAASRIFAVRIYHRVTMDEVARSARVGKGTLYRYFPSKEDLYLAIVDEAFGLLIRRLEAERAAAVPPATTLCRMIEAIVDTFAQHLPFFRLVHRGEGRLFLRKKQVVRARRVHIARLLAEVLDRGVEAGAFRKVDRALAPSMLIGMVWGTTLNHAEDTPAEVLASRIGDLCLHGLLQAPGPSA
ncbi:MAG: TetR/AcrR family transcriptional regulator [Candidatus Rokubacteria bacterium]|nr:TetR/AcrR family transcriptional regulator [Candidatus Rokubacteria bacterium]